MVVTREKKLGNLNGFTGGNFAGNVYDKDMLCPTISACSGGNTQPMVVDEMTEVKVLGNYLGHRSNFAGTVYDKEGLSPTLRTPTGGNTQPMIIDEKEKPIVVDMYNDRQIDGDVCGTLTTGCARNGSGTFGVVEKSERQDRIKAKRMPNGNIRFFQDNDSKSAVSELQLQSGDDVAQTITTLGNAKIYETERYRIRKLTERECFRLMGFSDSDFEKARAVNSATQIYKQSGNSIVPQVLMAIFSQMNIRGVKPWNEREVTLSE